MLNLIPGILISILLIGYVINEILPIRLTTFLKLRFNILYIIYKMLNRATVITIPWHRPGLGSIHYRRNGMFWWAEYRPKADIQEFINDLPSQVHSCVTSNPLTVKLLFISEIDAVTFTLAFADFNNLLD